MTSAKVTIAQQDRSAIISSLSGSSIGTVVNSVWGPTTPLKVTSPTKLARIYGNPDNTKGSSWNGAELLLANSDSVYITRAIHEDARYSAALVSGDPEGVDFNEYPKPDQKVDCIVNAITGGLGLNDIASYTFPTYTRNREFVDTKLSVDNQYADNAIEMSDISFHDGDEEETLAAGDFISFDKEPGESSDIFEIESVEQVTIRTDVINLDANLTGAKGDEVQKWLTPVLIDSTIYNTKMVVNSPIEFTTTINSNGNTVDQIIYNIEFSNPTAVSKVEWYDTSESNWVVLEENTITDIGGLSNIGTEAIAGYAIAGLAVAGRVSSIEIKLRVTFGAAGVQTVTEYLRHADNSPIAEAQYTLNVADNGVGTTGALVNKPANGAVSFSPAVYLTADAINTSAIKVSDSDFVHNEDMIFIRGNESVKAKVINKQYLVSETNRITFTTPITDGEEGEYDPEDTIKWMKYGDTEQRDLFLVYAKYPGVFGDQIKIGIREDKSYPDAFYLDVYFQGQRVESYEVSRNKRLDGFGYQMFIEDKVNGISEYIMVKNNELIDSSKIPQTTDYAIWQKVSEDQFLQTNCRIIEDVLPDDDEIFLDIATGLNLGDRIRFGSEGKNEYKIEEISGNAIYLDRNIELDEVEIGVGTYIYKFNKDLNDPENGIYDGVQYFKYTRLSPLTNYKVGDQYTLDGEIGYILDAGYNNVLGGSDGSAITVYDVITAFQKMANQEQYEITCFCDNGFAYPEVAQAIDTICSNRQVSHGFLSSSFTSEEAADATTAIVNYRNSLNLNSYNSSLFAGWIQVSDTYNQTKVWVAPSVFGCNTQSFVTRNYTAFTPAAGWVYGVLSGLDITNRFDEGERDTLVDAQINPIRYREGYGLAVWGNETLYTSPSPLQLRSVNILLITLKYGLQEYLERTLFEFNDDPTWTEVENTISTFIRDEIYLKGGLYDYQVSVKEVITDTDIDNRRMPVWIGLQPTMDIQTIPVTIGIFNKSVNISYSG